MRTIKKYGQVFDIKCPYWGVGGTIHNHFCEDCKKLSSDLAQARSGKLTGKPVRTFIDKFETVFFAALPFAVLLFFICKEHFFK